MKRASVPIPLVFFIGLTGLVAVIAKTSLFSPLVRFVHSPAGGFWPLLLCVLAGVAMLWLTYRLLHVVCGHYGRCFDQRESKERDPDRI